MHIYIVACCRTGVISIFIVYTKVHKRKVQKVFVSLQLLIIALYMAAPDSLRSEMPQKDKITDCNAIYVYDLGRVLYIAGSYRMTMM